MKLEELILRLQVLSRPALAGLYPPLVDKVNRLIDVLARQEKPFGAFMGLRTFEQQNKLWMQGRMTPGNIVTKAKAGESQHNYGLAVDLAEDADPENDKGIQWSWSKNADYLSIGKAAQGVGLEWGGFWKSFKDYPHVQLSGGLSVHEMFAIYQAHGNDVRWVWDEVDRRTTAEIGS